jgi:hypothetical protein
MACEGDGELDSNMAGDDLGLTIPWGLLFLRGHRLHPLHNEGNEGQADSGEYAGTRSLGNGKCG